MAKADRKSAKPKIAIYARYSDRSGKGKIRQQQHCASYARSIGAGEISYFSDSTGAVAVDERPGLSELLEKCERGEVDTVVVEDFDRIARSFHLSAAVLNRLEKVGVKLRIASEGRVDVARVKAVRKPGKAPKSKARSTKSKHLPNEE
jgi:DNA invertase Pin-like site-specific DNA recombinase